MSGNWEAIIALVVAVIIAYAVILWIGTVVWTYRDIRERTHDGWSQVVAVALVVLFNIPGLFLYLILRPSETLSEAYERRLEAEALMREMPEERPVCPRCQRGVREEFLLCPYCRTHLREPCLGCGRALELTWISCPYCGAQGPQANTAATVPAAPPIAAANLQPAEPPVPEPSTPHPQPAGTPQAGSTGQSTP